MKLFMVDTCVFFSLSLLDKAAYLRRHFPSGESPHSLLPHLEILLIIYFSLQLTYYFSTSCTTNFQSDFFLS